jgi:AraC-like DNA-binding protein
MKRYSGVVELLAGTAKCPPINEVRLAVKALLPDGHPALGTVAAEFGISSRTLQRHLAATGLSHSELVRQVRRGRACELLARPSVSISQIASRTGFASPSGFSRAFHAWTGLSPRDYRRQCDLA